MADRLFAVADDYKDKLPSFSKLNEFITNKPQLNIDSINAALSHAASVVKTGEMEKEIPFEVPLHRRCDSERMLANSADSPKVQHTSSHSSITGPSALGALNPEIYKSPEEGDLSEYPADHIGRLWFSLEYDRDNEKLTVTIEKVRNLPSREATSSNCCDPFVRLYMLPDERRFSQTKVRRKTCNPNFGESFVFDVNKDSLSDRILKVVIFDVDTLKRNLLMGTFQYSVKDYVFCKQQKLTTWRDVSKNDAEVTGLLGELHCSLTYNESGERLSITIIEAKDLLPVDNNQFDSLVKVSLSFMSKTLKTKKTRVIKKTNSPVFNESFAFKLHKDKLDNACLIVQVMALKPERQIGRITFGGCMFARGKALEHWQEMCIKKKESVEDWHFLTE